MPRKPTPSPFDVAMGRVSKKPSSRKSKDEFRHRTAQEVEFYAFLDRVQGLEQATRDAMKFHVHRVAMLVRMKCIVEVLRRGPEAVDILLEKLNKAAVSKRWTLATRATYLRHIKSAAVHGKDIVGGQVDRSIMRLGIAWARVTLVQRKVDAHNVMAEDKSARMPSKQQVSFRVEDVCMHLTYFTRLVVTESVRAYADGRRVRVPRGGLRGRQDGITGMAVARTVLPHAAQA